MSTLVRAATDVTLHYGPRPIQPQMRELKSEKGGRDKNFCGAHSMEESPTSKKLEKEAKVTLGKSTVTSNPACLVCKDPNHRVKECAEFSSKSLDERWKTVQQFGLCRNCLGAHGRRPCKLYRRCGIDGCLLKHHTLLHSQPNHQRANRDKGEENVAGSKAVTNHHYAGKTTLFRIIPVTLFGNNRSVAVYAFLDDGSERTLVEQDVVNKLGVEGEHIPLCLQWTSNVKRTESDSQRVVLQIAGSNGSKHTLSDVCTVSRLDLPRQSLHYSKLTEAYTHLQGLPIQDYD
ncbi:uncharacterized protein LOC134221537 [Armigeres subalbatus]|uniref:uncharacterized protein LOC134221537 n=1 Tax=Armigeres subalbatus TaxID=124917 RepID=UPI002ED46685